MKTKTVVPQMENTYSSFPTLTEHDGRLFVFYRQGLKSDNQMHGIQGKVKCFEIDKEICLNQFDENGRECLYDLGNDYQVFEGENEIDAVVSRLESNLFSLCTRKHIIGEPVQTYVSFSDSPRFNERYELKIDGIDWAVFYGKAFKWEQGYVFPAYGEFSELAGERPLLLITDDLSSWEVLSYLPGNLPGFVLNESSIAFDGEQYTIFMREDTHFCFDEFSQFGIWYSFSHDLLDWSIPDKLISSAHAPMSVYYKGEIYLSYRELMFDGTSAVALMSPFSKKRKLSIETYVGNPYDGGYSDINIIDDRMFVVYYIGNQSGEPFLRLTEINKNGMQETVF